MDTFARPISTVYTPIKALSSQKISVGLSLTQQRLTIVYFTFQKIPQWLSMADENVFFLLRTVTSEWLFRAILLPYQIK
ncbi:MAG: hypothetical protein WBX81_14765, partial [Nitrososphaeraceae archaeon]